MDMNDVRARLALLSERDLGRRIPGSSGHQYKLNPPVAPEVLARAEEAIGGGLPEDYRAFLLEGNGGGGPYWGLLSLEETLESIEYSYGSLAPLGGDSPLTEDIDFAKLCHTPESWEEQQAIYYDEPWCNGRLPIVEYGCGDWFSLVVRGPSRGRVWNDSLGGCSGLFDLRVSFATFYQRWLVDALDRIERQDFSPGHPDEFGNKSQVRLE
jgi:hypothetical protein